MSGERPGVLVTGGAGGIGGAVVRRFAADGHPVDFSHMGMAGEAAQLSDETGARGFESDTSDPAAVEALHANGPYPVLVCCAGVTRDGMLWKLAVEDFDAVVAVNLRGAWLQMRAAAPAMRAAGWGRIVLIGSINGTRGKAGQTNYSASKSGLIGLGRSAAKELGRKGVTVNIIEPGWVDTAINRDLPAEFRQAALDQTLTGKTALPEQVAGACAWLSSEEAAAVTGQVLRVDGGQLAGS